MKKLITATAIAFMVLSTAYAADKADTNDKETTAAPPKDATTYPCWDMMQGGHMQHMHGMMNGTIQMPPQGVKAHTCWDAMQNGHMMHMHNMHMMWDGAKSQPDQKK